MTEADVLRYIMETRKTCCSLDPINVSKLGEAYEFAAPAVGAIINSSFDEGHFVTTERCGLIRPYLKKIGLEMNDLSNYCPVTNLTHLSKIIERAMLDQMVPFLEEVGVVPHCQSTYRKHSPETALCKIHDELVSNTCHGKASILVLLDLSVAFDTVDHQLLPSDFSDCGVEGTALSLLESYLENREQCVAIAANHCLNQCPFSMVFCRSLSLVRYCLQCTLIHLLFFWKLMELVTTFLQMTRSCTSRLKILMKPNIGFHLSCMT